MSDIPCGAYVRLGPFLAVPLFFGRCVGDAEDAEDAQDAQDN